MLANMSQLSLVKDQLLSQGVNHFVVVSSSGHVIESSGEFEHREKQVLAYAILQQASQLLSGPDETLRRITMTFEEVTYVATTVVDNGERCGVVIRRPTSK